VKGPDFPTRGIIVGRQGIEDAYRTGRGSIQMRAVVEVEEINKRTCLVVTELPYQVNPDNLALKIAELVKDGKIKGIADVRDEGNERLGQRLVIVLRNDATPKIVLNNSKILSEPTCWPWLITSQELFALMNLSAIT
jgi:DNA gyrase subunit A